MPKAVIIAVALLLCSCARSSSNAIQAGTALPAHVEPVCVLKSPLPSSVAHKVVGRIDSTKQWYGGVEGLLPLVADEARKIGANAVVNLKTGHSVGFVAWARPWVRGTAVLVENPAELHCRDLGGEYR